MIKEITLENAKTNIGRAVKKFSERPFKSGLLVNIVSDVIMHPQLQIPAYTFIEDDSYVECRRCTTEIEATDHPLYQLTIDEGYQNLKVVNGFLCGLYRFAFTTGLVIGISSWGYYGRYCYPLRADAEEGLREWNGEGDPGGPWVKYKGEGGERSNYG